MYVIWPAVQVELDRPVLFGAVTALVIIHVNMGQACTSALLGCSPHALVRGWWNIHQLVGREELRDMPGAVLTKVFTYPSGDGVMFIGIIILARDYIGSCFNMYAQLVRRPD